MLLQMYGLIWLTDLRSKLSKLDLLTMLASALCHDLDHPGYNNVYQVAGLPPRPDRTIEPFVVADVSIFSKFHADQRQDRPGSALQ